MLTLGLIKYCDVLSEAADAGRNWKTKWEPRVTFEDENLSDFSVCFRAENQFFTSFAGLFLVPFNVFSYCSLKGGKSAPSAQRNHFKVVSLPPAGGQTGQRAVKEEKKHLCDCVWQQFVLKLSIK